MPAKSKAQQKAAGAALVAKRGVAPKSALKGASRAMEKSMTEGELEGLAETKLAGLPARVAASQGRNASAAKKKVANTSAASRKPAPRKAAKTASARKAVKKSSPRAGAKK